MIKENFCPACLTLPISMLVGVNNFSSKNYKKWKNNLLFSGIITLILILISIYFLFIKKCNQCLK